jgi:hypothetical protein
MEALTSFDVLYGLLVYVVSLVAGAALLYWLLWHEPTHKP